MHDFQYKALVGKKIKVRSNCTNHLYEIGKDYILTHSYGGGEYRGREIDTEQQMPSRINYCDFDVVENILGEGEEKGFKKKKILTENKDQYGFECVLTLEKDEETIYISSGTRSLLELKPDESIGIGVDYDTSTVYIFKETEAEGGIAVPLDGNIKSTPIYRDLINYVFSKTISVDPRRIKNPDYPDNVFYKLTPYNSLLKEKFTKLFEEEVVLTNPENGKEVLPTDTFPYAFPQTVGIEKKKKVINKKQEDKVKDIVAKYVDAGTLNAVYGNGKDKWFNHEEPVKLKIGLEGKPYEGQLQEEAPPYFDDDNADDLNLEGKVENKNIEL